MTLQRLLRARIEALQLPKQDIAARAGVNPTYISDILSGKKRSIQQRFIPRLAHALQV
jgi:transcriptional regulator with XRE-family HTH domain